MVPGSSLFLIELDFSFNTTTVYYLSHFQKTYFSLIIFIAILCRYLFVLIYRITYNNNS
jgi:hypothetical protein